MTEYLLQEMYDALIKEFGSMDKIPSESREMLALGDNIPKKVFIELLETETTGVLLDLMCNSTLSTEYLFDVFHYSIWSGDPREFFNNRKEGERVYTGYLGTDKTLTPASPIIFKHMVGHKNASTELLRYLAHVNNTYVQAFISSHSNFDRTVLDELLLTKIDDWNVIEPLLDSPYMDGETIYEYLTSLEGTSGYFARKMVLLNEKHKAKLVSYLRTVGLGEHEDIIPGDWFTRVVGWEI